MACGSSGPDGADAGLADAGLADAASADAAPTTPEFPQIPDQGGPRLSHPQLVTITYAEDSNRPVFEAHARWIVSSHWLALIGPEYGIGPGSVLGNVQLPEAAPSEIGDQQIEQRIARGIADHTLPVQADGKTDQTLYIIHFPARTTVSVPTVDGPALSCDAFGGYHSEAATGFLWAVIPFCAAPSNDLALKEAEAATAHELIEAATDPFVDSAPGLRISRVLARVDPWAILGGEVADLCELEPYYEQTFYGVFVYSNAAAQAGEDPCQPSDPLFPYFGARAAVSGKSAPPGGSVSFELLGWTLGPVAEWDLSAVDRSKILGYRIVQGAIQLSARTITNGGKVTLTLTIPADAPSGSYAVTTVYSWRGTSRHSWPVVVRVE